MNLFSDWTDSINKARCEILFEDRNKSYGAYVIRKNYVRSVVLSLLFTLIAVSLICSFPVITGYFDKNIRKQKKFSESIVLDEPPPIDEYAPPPPPPVEQPPIRQTIKFTPPLVVNDDQSNDAPTQEEIKNVQVSVTTQDGLDIPDLPNDPVINSDDDDKIFTVVEEMPAFPGGDKKLLDLLARINYPVSARENGISGAVYLTFVVEKNGKIRDAKILKGIGGGCDEEALRVLNSLPDWIPGKQNGRPVAVRSSVRVNFTLN